MRIAKEGKVLMGKCTIIALRYAELRDIGVKVVKDELNGLHVIGFRELIALQIGTCKFSNRKETLANQAAFRVPIPSFTAKSNWKEFQCNYATAFIRNLQNYYTSYSLSYVLHPNLLLVVDLFR